jgi:hypothetical protein
MGKYNIEVEAIDKASNKAKEKIELSVERTGPSVYLSSTKTVINEGENAVITLSAINPIGNPPMKVQLILIPPSGVSIFGSDWIKGGAGSSYTGEFPLPPGDNVRAISIHMKVNQPGTQYVDSEIYYEVEGKRITQRDRITIEVIPSTPDPINDFITKIKVFTNSLLNQI